MSSQGIDREKPADREALRRELLRRIVKSEADRRDMPKVDGK